jgi:hypothetical protein
MNNRARATLLLVAVLAAGAAVGWVGHDRYQKAHPPRRHGVDAIVSHLTQELDLSAAQRDSVYAIITRGRGAIDSLWADAHPRFEAVRSLTHSRIEKLLTA